MLRRLPETVINRIAAGEVVERPASAVKELVENSFDAGASRIDIIVRDGGQSLIRVVDDGCGMSRSELELCIERHATSKLDDDDLTNIHTFGFRGEALPSMAAVSRMTITSRQKDMPEGWSIRSDGGIKAPAQPAACGAGTTVDIRDLFFATPARLKFLKTPATELRHILHVVQKLAIAHPEKTVNLTDDQRSLLRFPGSRADQENSLLKRLQSVFGNEFADAALRINAERDGIRLSGFVSPPTVHRRQRVNQMLFVNNRPVQDPLLYTVVRVAYQGLIATDRHPYVILFLSVPFSDVDTNVHPMKSEVRFREVERIRSLLIGTLKATLHELTAAHSVSSFDHGSLQTATAPSENSYRIPPKVGRRASQAIASTNAVLPLRVAEPMTSYAPATDPSTVHQSAEVVEPDPGAEPPLGHAKAQLHKTYIVAQNQEGVIIVDQHAAHERLVQEELLRSIEGRCVVRQSLLIPEVVELGDDAASVLLDRSDELQNLGLTVEGFGAGTVVVREIPAALGTVDVRLLIRDIADDLSVFDDAVVLRERLSAVYARVACHYSVRAGRAMSIEEMNHLLRAMEKTPRSGQCSHGRPTFVQLRLDEIERLFGRK